MDIARVVGADTRNDGYCSGNGYMVTWALGHLVSLATPDTYGYTKTAAEDLPMLPDPFRLVSRQMRTDRGMVTDIAASKQLKVIESVFNRCDSIIVATDAGREGELIFRWIYDFLGCTKPFRRLWISSLTDEAIRKGLEELKDGSEYDSLYAAADSRAKADWLVGMNASRALAIVSGSSNNSIGRVQTPTLAMICSRYRENRSFVSTPYWQLHVTLNGGTSHRRFFHPATFDDRQKAETAYRSLTPDSSATVTKVERRKTLQQPPLLYDLTALQKDCNVHLDLPAAKTLDIAQSLYEKKFTTYPRVDTTFLSDDIYPKCNAILNGIAGEYAALLQPLRGAALKKSKKVFDSSKVTDHHALLPTKSMANADLAALPAGERNVLRLIAARLLCAVGEPHCYAETTLTTICAGEEFSAKGKLVLSDGWRAMERKMLGELLGKQKEPAVLPDVQEQSQCSVAGVELKEGQTSPPKHFTEDLLLHAMETASADSMPEGVERQGIGTPATRAATIEKLVQKGFLERKGTKKTKVLLPTDKGKALITVMPEEIQSADMTADWEAKLLQIERGEMEPSEFMTEINTMITELVKNTEMKKGVNALMKNKIIGVCPNCGANVVEREKGWFCENRECRFVLWKDNAFFKRLGKRLDSHVADKLLRDGRVRLKDCKSAKGKTYNATVLLSCEADGRSKFSLEFEGGC